MAQVKWYDNILDGGVGEAISFNKVHLETDCLELIQIWGKRETQRFIFAPILSEIDEFKFAITDFDFTFANRYRNEVAHLLAKQVTDIHWLELWHVIPTCVHDLILYRTPALYE